MGADKIEYIFTKLPTSLFANLLPEPRQSVTDAKKREGPRATASTKWRPDPGGDKVSKEMLNCHPAALSAAVLARPDAKSGDVLATYIETREDAKVAAAGIAPRCRARLVFARASRSSAGIIQKFALRHPAKSSSAIE
ncbi:hypothetical protein [Zoogloea ramigera]|jgi:hypothetical protein|uniref:hypothetical protein n=1 Tax=Zoogloea ramigera TaxID=350 RepID=UPI0011414BA1|nr:hypothetical protein [Zoogloea ramigera]